MKYHLKSMNQEHETIKKILGIGLHLIRNWEENSQKNQENLKKVIHFLDFFNNHYHSKKEGIFLEYLARADIPLREGLTLRLEREHSTVNDFIEELDEILKENDLTLSSKLLDFKRMEKIFYKFACFYFQHLETEEHLFPLAQTRLSNQDWLELEGDYHDFERKNSDSYETHQKRFQSLLKTLGPIPEFIPESGYWLFSQKQAVGLKTELNHLFA